MFDIRQLDFSNGIYTHDGRINGMEVMIMDSDEKADKIIKDFEEIMDAELSPYAALNQAFERNNVSQDDFTDFDLKRIERKVNAIYKEKKDWRY